MDIYPGIKVKRMLAIILTLIAVYMIIFNVVKLKLNNFIADHNASYEEAKKYCRVSKNSSG